MLQLPELLVPPDLLAQEKLKAPLGRLELIAGVLEVLHFFQDFSQRRLVVADVELLAGLGRDVARAR